MIPELKTANPNPEVFDTFIAERVRKVKQTKFKGKIIMKHYYHLGNGKRVIGQEWLKANEGIITYSDFSKKPMTRKEFESTHRLKEAPDEHQHSQNQK